MMSGLVPAYGNQPHRWYWWNAPASSSSRGVTGEVHSVVIRWCGHPQWLSKPGDVVARMADGHVHMCSFAKENPNLFFWVACHVSRTLPSFHIPSLETRWLGSWFSVHTFGSLYVVSKNIPPTQFCAICSRCDT